MHNLKPWGLSMSNQKDYQEFSQDLLLEVPNLDGYQMIDWLILALWVYVFLLPTKNHSLTLIYVSIVELLWGIYDLSIGEYAQSIPFFFYFFSTALSCLKVPQKRTEQ